MAENKWVTGALIGVINNSIYNDRRGPTMIRSRLHFWPPTRRLDPDRLRQDIPFPPREDKNQDFLNTIANACGILAVLALLGTISCIVPWDWHYEGLLST